MIQLRPYQSAAIEAVYGYFGQQSGNPLIVLPTGTGKGFVIAAFVARAIRDWADTRILVVTHVKELIAQNYSEMIRLWPEAPAGIYSAGLNKRDLHAQILFAGIQSIHKRAYDIQRCDLALIDEAHLIPRTSNTIYRRFLSNLATINPHLKVIGFTATPYRLDSGMLHEGNGAVHRHRLRGGRRRDDRAGLPLRGGAEADRDAAGHERRRQPRWRVHRRSARSGGGRRGGG